LSPWAWKIGQSWGKDAFVVDAAFLRWRQAKTDPLLPRLEVGYLAGSFGGGINSDTIRFRRPRRRQHPGRVGAA